MNLRITAGLIALCACGSGDPAMESRSVPAPDSTAPILGDTPHSSRQVGYVIDAKYAPVDHRIDATMTMTWRNDGREAVTKLPLHLYMNAFKNERSLFWQESGGDHRGVEADDEGWGEISLRKVELAGAPLPLTDLVFPGPDETVVEIPLSAPLAVGQSISVEIEFIVLLPEVFARTGYKGDFAMVAQWFPKIGVRAPDESGAEIWHCEPFHLNSEFFADFATFDVTLTVPDTHVVAATGVLAESRQESGTHVLRYQAADVHDFAWMADPFMETISATAKTELGETEVRVYFREPQREFAERHLRAGVASIQSFSRRTVAYPWPRMSIIDPPPDAIAAGGMEYPTLVTTAGDFAFTRGAVRLPEFVTVHEVGHNWFQGILASNEVEEAWLDEGVNQYINGLVMLEIYGENDTFDEWGFRGDSFAMWQAQTYPASDLADPIATTSYEFVDNGTYGAATYFKTALALRTLENIVGRKRFGQAFRGYAKARAFTHPTGEQFFADLQGMLGEEIDWFVKPAFYGRGTVKLVVQNVNCDETHPVRGLKNAAITSGEGPDHPDPKTKWRCSVVVANLGTIAVPFDVRIKHEDGKSERRSLERGRTSARFEIEAESPITAVIADPDNAILLNEGGSESIWRSDGPSGGSSKLAGGFHSILLALLPLGGL